MNEHNLDQNEILYTVAMAQDAFRNMKIVIESFNSLPPNIHDLSSLH